MIEPVADLATGKFGMQRRNETVLSADRSQKFPGPHALTFDETKST